MKWNAEKEIVIEYNDILGEIPKDDAEIKEMIPQIEIFLIRWNKLLWQHIYSQSTNDANQKKYIKYKTHLNIEGEQSAFRNAIIEIVMGALVSDMHLNAYTDKISKTMPETVNQFLRNGRLIQIGRNNYEIPEWSP